MSLRKFVGCRSRARLLALAVVAAGVVLLAPALRAQEAAKAVRLSFVDGQVKIAQGNQLLADPALQNTPLFEGTQVLTSDDGKAELEFDDGSVVRLSPDSSLTLAVLRGQGSSGEAEIVIESGLVFLELQGAGEAKPIRVRFGDNVVTAEGFTVLRINLDNPLGELAVFSGNVHLERGNGMALDLHGGESATPNAADPGQYTVAESIEPDTWDTWNSDRDQALTTLAAARTGAANGLSNNNPAWDDLDANGNWYNVPGQGYVWSPYEAANAGWEPYGNGYWMWTPRFGYIWVSGNAWGYMPYQCGAWNYFNDFGWGWAPGGMCNPWWGGGGWAFNIGIAPFGYRHPFRPQPGPHKPIFLPMNGRRMEVRNPVVPVNHRPQSPTAGLPPRDRNAFVAIGGHFVEPLRPVAQRPRYDAPNSGFMNRSQPVDSGARTPGSQNRPPFLAPGASRPGNAPTVRPYAPVVRPTAPVVRPSAPVVRPSAPVVRPSGGGQYAPPPAPRPSSGGSSPSRPSGGGGGGSHSSGGGSHR